MKSKRKSKTTLRQTEMETQLSKMYQFSSVAQSCRLFATPWIQAAAQQKHF